ncbi:VOC family protein [Brachybacterium sp. YJGR34]|uniref:VOC family protein n=1 Tax=Brachybacterium sp. YJGR34 TaxID=2059911 RepID=UPI000E0A6F39|nr:VOC family protein [Brachybacterium sp. YJGR34]
MTAPITLGSVTLNAPDALTLARFYAEILRGTVRGDSRFAVVTSSAGEIDVQQVADFRPPQWPTGNPPMHIHLDLLVQDLAGAEERVLAAGATRFAAQPNAEHCLVFADPAGHPFCLTLWDGARALAEAAAGGADGAGS